MMQFPLYDASTPAPASGSARGRRAHSHVIKADHVIRTERANDVFGKPAARCVTQQIRLPKTSARRRIRRDRRRAELSAAFGSPEVQLSFYYKVKQIKRPLRADSSERLFVVRRS